MSPCRRCQGRDDLCFSDAAAFLGISPSSLRRTIAERRHPVFILLPHGHRRFPIAELEAFKNRNTRRPVNVAPRHFGGPSLVEQARREVMRRIGGNR